MASLAPDECWAKLREAQHGVLATLQADGSPHLVPVVFAVLDQRSLAIPVDTVKAKRSTGLQRVANVVADPRVSVLVEHYDEDWSALWWVRADGAARVLEGADLAAAIDALAARFVVYRQPGAVTGALAVDLARITGWHA